MSTIKIDAYSDWTIPQLKRRCRELARSVMHKDDLIRMLVKRIPTGPDAIPEGYRDEVRRIFTALDD